jgi:hypothetical protein
MFEQDIDFEQVSLTLESISKNYSPESIECKTLELAGLALFYVYSEQVEQRFRRWRESMQGDLSEKQKEHLRSMGIDPEAGGSTKGDEGKT